MKAVKHHLKPLKQIFNFINSPSFFIEKKITMFVTLRCLHKIPPVSKE